MDLVGLRWISILRLLFPQTSTSLTKGRCVIQPNIHHRRLIIPIPDPHRLPTVASPSLTWIEYPDLVRLVALLLIPSQNPPIPLLAPPRREKHHRLLRYVRLRQIRPDAPPLDVQPSIRAEELASELRASIQARGPGAHVGQGVFGGEEAGGRFEVGMLGRGREVSGHMRVDGLEERCGGGAGARLEGHALLDEGFEFARVLGVLPNEKHVENVLPGG
jgi:hypothetical protein